LVAGSTPAEGTNEFHQITTGKKKGIGDSMRILSQIAVGAAAALVFALAGCTQQSPSGVNTDGWPEKLVFGAVPAEESNSLVDSYATIIAVLEKELGLDVEFSQVPDYEGIIAGQVSGSIDIAQYGPFSYVLAGIRGAEIEVVGVMTDGPDSEPGYQSYMVTKGNNTSISSIDDAKGKIICFVDPASTSGYLYPTAGLLSVGIDPETGITPVFAGAHDASALSVVRGECDAGFASDSVIDNNLIESGDLKAGDLKIVWKSEVIAGSPIAMQATLPQSLKDEIRRIIIEDANIDALVGLGICDSKDACDITDQNVWGFVSKPDSFYDGVRTVCEVTRSAKCE
jgi:phosphonate transport system substrate-binding protein